MLRIGRFFLKGSPMRVSASAYSCARSGFSRADWTKSFLAARGQKRQDSLYRTRS